ncbi:MAG: nucleoside transporter [Candidatus Omnitrophica bacterium]|nr:nucleoside transporter [Candidatus Omnitrophota bacterium]
MSEKIVALSGMFLFMLVAWVFSSDHRRINWQVIFWSLALQLSFAAIIFRFSAGYVFFDWANSAVIKFLSFAKEGMYFLFGALAVSPGTVGPAGEGSLGFILAFQALPAIVFFSALMALLYYLKIMPFIVRLFALVFRKLMRISGAESLCAASNIFVGVESALTIRPFLARMTSSELCTILTAGMGTIASTVLAVYVSFLHDQFPTIAGHLISASLLSAPACIMMSKLICPEKETPETLGRVPHLEKHSARSWIEAIINGANDGVKLCVGVVALLLAFLGLLAMANWILAKCAYGVGFILNTPLDLSLEKLLGWVFYPLVRIAGVSASSAGPIAQILGERAVVTELVSYQHLSELIRTGAVTDVRSIVIATYSLCGFAHFASLAIFVGGISALAPERAAELARVGFRALLAATLACLLTGAIAGLFFSGQQSILMSFN